jgi:hypothetical protein
VSVELEYDESAEEDAVESSSTAPAGAVDELVSPAAESSTSGPAVASSAAGSDEDGACALGADTSSAASPGPVVSASLSGTLIVASSRVAFAGGVLRGLRVPVRGRPEADLDVP